MQLICPPVAALPDAPVPKDPEEFSGSKVLYNL